MSQLRERSGLLPLVLVTGLLAALGGGGAYGLGRMYATGDASAVTAPTATPSPSPTASLVASTPSATPSPTGRPAALSREALQRAKQQTVRLSHEGGSGSGSVVSADGLVLTNAHVAAPDAPGQAFWYGVEKARRPRPPYLTVSVNPDGVGAAVPRYRASLVAADGYLDLAVLRIDAAADGGPLPAGTRFDPMPVGTVEDMTTGDPVTIIGFPGVADSERVNVTSGPVSFLPDPQGRVPGDQFEMETAARISGGNSGGAAIDTAGALVGVPTRAGKDDEGAYTGRIRTVNLAEDLLAAARAGRSYASPWVVEGTGVESAQDLGWTTGAGQCGERGTWTLPVSQGRPKAQVRLRGLAAREDVTWAVTVDGQRLSGRQFQWRGPVPDGCLEVPLPSGAPGRYRLTVWVGPLFQQVLQSELEVQGGA